MPVDGGGRRCVAHVFLQRPLGLALHDDAAQVDGARADRSPPTKAQPVLPMAAARRGAGPLASERRGLHDGSDWRWSTVPGGLAAGGDDARRVPAA